MSALPDEPPSQHLFAVVVPAYNEESGIQACVTAVTAELERHGRTARLIVVNDGSSDATGRVLSSLEPNPHLTVVTHERNAGYGAALRTGTAAAAAAGYEYVLFMDSDLTNDPRDIPLFMKHMSAEIDVIKASRYVKGGGADGVPRWRVALSVLGNAIARRLYRLPIRDCTNGFRAVKSRLLVDHPTTEAGFAVIMEELYLLRSVARTYAEVPVRLTTRAAALRPSVFSYTPRALGRFLKYPVMAAVDDLTGRTKRPRARTPAKGPHR